MTRVPHALRLTPRLINGSNASLRGFAFSNTGVYIYTNTNTNITYMNTCIYIDMCVFVRDIMNGEDHPFMC